VLIDSYSAHLESWRITCAARGLTITDEQFAAGFGRTSREFIRAVWPGQFDDAGVREFDLEKEAAYREILRTNFPEMDGAADLIQSAHADGFRLAIGSSAPPANVAVAVEALRNGNLISATVDGSQVKEGKPHPDVFLIAAKKLQIDPVRCAVIEDALVGVEAARRAGMTVVALLGTADPKLLAAAADLTVGSLRELSPKLIDELIQSAHGRNRDARSERLDTDRT
jgi:beta-phosphoglucomutase